MPIITKAGLPVNKILEKEGVQILEEDTKKENNAIQVAILNLMPVKQDTELQLLRKLSKTKNNLQVTFVKISTYQSKHVSSEYLENFYEKFDTIKNKKWDGLIITGAPIEMLDFEEVIYWEELKKIMEWSKSNVKSTLHICWGAQAGLYYHYGVKKYILPDKKFGIFEHEINDLESPLIKGLKNNFVAPHSRHTTVQKKDIEERENLKITATSKDAGIFIVENKQRNQIFDMGHLEYDIDTLDKEYKRDKEKGLEIQLPKNYYKGENPEFTWKENGDIFYSNWVNSYLAQK